jgi:tetratricopeptide (TPR) repeat protein
MKEVFAAAMEKPPEEREAFLEEACPGAAVREEVRKLLEAENRPPLEGPIAGRPARGSLPPAIGRYRIVRLLGEGGMGAVYEAEQDQPRRRVAIKAIRAGFANPASLRRFEHEAQALGRLHHPGIAQIYEAGAADTGFGSQPYFAMEFIQGTSLVRYAEDRRLGVRERLELMVKICQAVQHAHQRGIIHRDLKPGNILVDETGQPKIVDFGVARATDADTRATCQTDVGQILGTLAYMSPEQVLADPLELDTRSDVYSLGVILYELLTGRLPYSIGGQLTKALQTIREEDPAPLSSIDRAYRGDIETIAAKALEKDKTRRYSSAAELGADIQRYLNDEPVLARPSTAAYQLRKFASRHSALVASVAVAVLLLVAGIAASTWEAARARRAEFAALAEKSHADTESAASRAISDFLQNDLLAQASANVQARPGNRPDPDLKVRTALDRAAARIAGRFDRQPLVEAAIRQTIGNTYRDLGVYPQAQAHFERALELRRRALGAHSRETLETMASLAALYREQGKYTEAEPLLTQVVAGWQALHTGETPESVAAQWNLALVYQEETKYPQAEKMLATVLETQRRVLGKEHPETLATMGSLANLYSTAGNYAAAEPLFREVVDLDRRVLGLDHPETQTTMFNLATLDYYRNKFAEAEAVFREVIESQRRVLGEEHPATLASMVGLGRVYSIQTRFAEAEPLFVKALETRKRTLGPEHPDTLESMNDVTNLYLDLNRYDAAEALARQALEGGERVYGREHRATLDAAFNLAVVYRLEGKPALAEPLLLWEMEAERRLLAEDHPSAMLTVYELAVDYRLEGKYPEAEKLATKAYASFLRNLGEEHHETLVAATGLGTLYQEEGKLSEAEPLLTGTLEKTRRVLGPTYPATLACLTSLAKVRLAQHRYAEAESLLREALGAGATFRAYVWQLAERRSLLGLAVMERGRFAEAEPLLVEGYRGLAERRSAVPAAVSVPEAGQRIVRLYNEWGKSDAARQWSAELQAAIPPAKP